MEDSSVTSVADGSSVPDDFRLQQNFPNPFNPETTINYQLPAAADIRLEVYNFLGVRVLTLVRKRQPAGFYAVQWQGKDDSGQPVTSGVYVYRLTTTKFVENRKMLVLR